MLGKDLLKVTLHKIVGGGGVLVTIGTVAIFVQKLIVVVKGVVILVEGTEMGGRQRQTCLTSLLFVRFTAADRNGDGVRYSVGAEIG